MGRTARGGESSSSERRSLKGRRKCVHCDSHNHTQVGKTFFASTNTVLSYQTTPSHTFKSYILYMHILWIYNYLCVWWKAWLCVHVHVDVMWRNFVRVDWLWLRRQNHVHMYPLTRVTTSLFTLPPSYTTLSIHPHTLTPSCHTLPPLILYVVLTINGFTRDLNFFLARHEDEEVSLTWL